MQGERKKKRSRVNATDISELGKIRFVFRFSFFFLSLLLFLLDIPTEGKKKKTFFNQIPAYCHTKKVKKKEEKRETFGCVHVTWYDRFFDNNHAYVHRTHKLLPKKEGVKSDFSDR